MYLKMLLASSVSLLNGLVLCVALMGIGFAEGSWAACVDHQTQVNQALQTQDVDELEVLLNTLESQEVDCSGPYLGWFKLSMAQIIAKQVSKLTQQGQLKEAMTLLNRAPTTWITQTVRGQIAQQRKKWKKAAYFYNQALDLIDNKGATPQAPPQPMIEKVFQLASRSQVLAGNLDNTVSRSGQASGMMRGKLRGFKPKKRLIPIQFAYNKPTLSEKGENAAKQLAAYLKQQNIKKIILIGHTDSKGSDRYNLWLSEKRAGQVKRYLEDIGVNDVSIRTTGKGERKPLQLDNPASYTNKEIDQLNRRVEFVIK